MTSPPPLTADRLRALFDAPAEFSLGLEEEVMVLDGGSLDLVPRAAELLEQAAGDRRFKPELPLAQVEIVTAPHRSVADAVAELRAGRIDLAAAGDRAGLRLAAAGVHPFADPEGPLHPGERYRRIREEYAGIARRQLVCGLQVHVAVGGAERTLAVYNALRGRLPEIAALAANGPFHGGRDLGLASVRPTISETLPRQGVPPAFGSWEGFAEALRWGARAGSVPEPRLWWWEVRPHPGFGTLEVRVPDAQAALEDAAAVAALVHAVVVALAQRHDAGEPLDAAPTWRIEENRWSALRHGVEGTMADLETGAPEPTRDRLHRLVEELEPVAARHGGAGALAGARALIARNGALQQRAAAAEGGPRAAARWLADRFVPGSPGED